MNIFNTTFLLGARDNGFEWVVPVLVVVFWIVTGIAKSIAAAKAERKSNDGGEEKKMRYKPIPDTSSQQPAERQPRRDAPIDRVRQPVPAVQAKPKPEHRSPMQSLKKAMHDAMEEAYAQQQKPKAPKPVARRAKKVRRPTVRKAPASAKPVYVEPVKEVEVTPDGSAIRQELHEGENIRKAIIYSEILGKPLAFRNS